MTTPTAPSASSAAPMDPAGPASAPGVVVPRDAATVAIVRDHRDGGLEALLLRRTHRATFVAGAHVFPGGALDATDSQLDAHLSHPPDAVPAGFAVAAVRECFEEAGILFAHRRNESPIAAAELAVWRAELSSEAVSFAGLVEREDLRLDTSAFWTWSRWVTPVGSPKRFDTRFFVAVAPPGQDASPDDAEITECRWFRPEQALAHADAGEMLLITPTRSTLAGLAAFRSTSELHASVQARRGPGRPDLPGNGPFAPDAGQGGERGRR